MNMKRLLTLVAFFATIQASAQQVNPVPDYVFANRMSAGRNTVTDTAAYFSIGPRYGATRGMMPPMVVDTASFSANKRNGLLIFSVQKNKFLYWDSVGVKWAEMAGTGGIALTSADTAALLSTRAWRQKGIDSLAAIRVGGSGTINYVPKFTGTTTIGNSQIFDNGTNVTMENAFAGTKYLYVTNTNTGSSGASTLIVNTDASGGRLEFISNNSANSTLNGVKGASIFNTASGVLRIGTKTNEAIRIDTLGRVGVNTTTPMNIFDVSGTIRAVAQTVPSGGAGLEIAYASGTSEMLSYDRGGGSYIPFRIRFSTGKIYGGGGTGGIDIFSSGEVAVNSTTDAGDYKLQVGGNIYSTGSITTGAPSGGSIKPWKIGEAATVSPTSPNRTLRVEVDGVVYYIHAKTTND